MTEAPTSIRRPPAPNPAERAKTIATRNGPAALRTLGSNPRPQPGASPLDPQTATHCDAAAPGFGSHGTMTR